MRHAHLRSADREAQLAALSEAPRTPIDDSDEWVGPSLERANGDVGGSPAPRRPRAPRSSSSAVEIKVQLPPNKTDDEHLIERMQAELDEMDGGDRTDLERRLAALKGSSSANSAAAADGVPDDAEWLGPPPGEVRWPCVRRRADAASSSYRR